jgi:hypothetical protein
MKKQPKVSPEELRQRATNHIWYATFLERVAALGRPDEPIRKYVTEQQIQRILSSM